MSDRARHLEYVLPLSIDRNLRWRYRVLDEELPGNFRFGLLLEVIDKLAERVARNYAEQLHGDAWVVTAAIDRVLVRQVVDIERDLVCHASINHVGRTSMEVGIRVEHPGEPAAHVASCYLTMVARRSVRGEETGAELSPLRLQTDTERRRAEQAEQRRERHRLQQLALQEPPTRDEYLELARLHAAQEAPGFDGQLCGRLEVGAWERTFPEQENVPTRIFGGYLMRRAYELSSICAERLAPHRPIVAAVNRINFFHPVRLGDTLHFTSRVVYTDRSLICVEAGIERISRDRSSKALSNSCLFTFVNVDGDLTPHPVPPVFPTTYAEDARYLAAMRSCRELVAEADGRARCLLTAALGAAAAG
ncbi:hotdog domain-containing protein [Rubrivivax gelatinosus]|uniref:Acyl-CoA hydrolase n=1 Tax=Rubrivivax gelatinosus TaxID=28068 RepID=A0A4R2M4G7_RUBGE|nr:hotdog domain-containing protein [Rubrivivax gelatinosus]MBK1689856.1 acyl-CoA thioesterase [Rubrivivax gelatinosus]TCO97135.1 acyl-CoA hydrolase [Rubrivivax gelatinosus]